MTQVSHDLVEHCREFLANYYRDEIGELAQHYPREQRSLRVDYQDIYRYDRDLATDVRKKPEQIIPVLEEALPQVDIPVAVSFDNAHVRVYNLPEEYTFFPGEFSPTEHKSEFRTIRGDVLVSTDTYSKIQIASFECKRCGTHTTIPQVTGEWQEPHECQGCERQGPFRINYDRSEFIDGETIQLQTPPEISGGTNRTLQVFVEDDITGQVEMGDRIAVSGTLHLNQQTQGRNQKTGKFEPYLDGHCIQIEEATTAELDVDADVRDRVQELASGTDGDPLTVAAKSFHTAIHGHETEKKALVLSIIGGATNTDDIRGKFHVLFIGDPSTGKSQLINRVDEIAVRSIAVSGQQSSSAGLVSTATQGEFSDGRWTLSPGAFVKANEGVVTIDELDDMNPDDRKAMLEPMANQRVNVSKAGINATLSTQTAVTAAANPKHSRFDPYEPLDEQFGFESNLLSRFDLVFTFRDQPDKDRDADIAEHRTRYRDAKIRDDRDVEMLEGQEETIEQPVADEILRAWLALANKQPDPVYANDEIRKELEESFVRLRGANGYEETAEVPVTHRKLGGVERVARAHAKLEFSETIEQRHVEQAIQLVGQSMQDYQTTEDGTLDADIAETGTSKSQKDRKRAVRETVEELQEASDEYHAAFEDIVDELADYDEDKIEHEIQKYKSEGVMTEPQTRHYRWIGRV